MSGFIFWKKHEHPLVQFFWTHPFTSHSGSDFVEADKACQPAEIAKDREEDERNKEEEFHLIWFDQAAHSNDGIAF